jgi:hypothetical protein
VYPTFEKIGVRGLKPAAICVVAFSLLSCTQAGGGPASSKLPIEPTAKALADLFQRECIDQEDQDWVRDEIERIRWQDCWDDDNGSDCMLQDASSIAWTVQVKGHGDIQVSVDNPHVGQAAAKGSADCAIYAPEDLGPAVKGAVSLLRIKGRSPAGPYPDSVTDFYSLDQAFTWRAAGREPLELTHIRSMKSYMQLLHSKGLDSNVDPAIDPVLGDHRRTLRYPWILSYAPAR